ANATAQGTGVSLTFTAINTPSTITDGADAIGPITVNIGDGIGGASADQLVLLGSNQINDIAFLNVRASGKLDLNNQSDTNAGTLTLESGLTSSASIATGTGTLFLGNNNTNTVQAQAGTVGGTASVTISGKLALNHQVTAVPTG